MAEKKDLVQIIRDNPGAVATIDNDMWWLMKPKPADFDSWTDEARDDWRDDESNRLADSDDRFSNEFGDGYGSGNCYGGDILQALAIIVGIKIESV